MADTYIYSGNLVKSVGSVQEEAYKFSYTYSAEEAITKVIVLPEVDADNLTNASQVYKVDMDFINVAPPMESTVKLVVVTVLSPNKRIVVKINVPNNVINAMNTANNPSAKTSSDSTSFANTSYNDINGIIVRDQLVIGGRIDNIYINRWPLRQQGNIVTADSGECKVSIKIIG